MAVPEWVDFSPRDPRAAGAAAVPLSADDPGPTGLNPAVVSCAGPGPVDSGTAAPPHPVGLGPDIAEVPVAVGVLMGACSRFFDPVVLAQLDAALACELAGRARVRADEATALVRDALGDGRSMESVAGLLQHAGAAKAAVTKAEKLAALASGVLTALGGTVETGTGFDPVLVDRVDAGALVEVIAVAEAAKNALCAVQAQAETVLMAQQRLTQARAGMPREQLGRGVGAQIGLARGESPHRGRQLGELASVLVREMPHTLHALTVGALTEYRATIMARETVFLSLEDRGKVDALICSDPQHAGGLGNRELGATARKAAYALEPEAFVQRLEKAESERYVSLRPAADGMTLLTALLPLRQGVRILATLTKVADSAKSSGDDRGKGQLMADTLIHRLTHHTPCPNESNPTSSGNAGAGICTSVDEPDMVLELVMTDRALFEGANDPALLVGYDPIPASTARNWILGRTRGNHPGGGEDDGPTTANGGSQNGSGGSRGEDDSGSGSDNFGGAGHGAGHDGKGMRTPPRIWLKRLFTHPDTNTLLAMDSRARLFPEGMKEFLRIQDQRCRTPWCDGPIRQYDHIKAYATGGSTSISNGQGLCTACNQAKETPGWTTTTDERRPIHTAGTTSTTSNAGTSSTRITTPTGHQYISTAPPLPGTSPRQPSRRANRRC